MLHWTDFTRWQSPELHERILDYRFWLALWKHSSNAPITADLLWFWSFGGDGLVMIA